MTFKYIKPTNWIHTRTSDHLATSDEIEVINQYIPTIKNVSDFYIKNLKDKKIDYIYKEGNEIKLLPVMYKKENFPHLTGINFANIHSDKKVENLINGTNSEPIIIERRSRTIKKLEILGNLTKVLNAENTVLANLQQLEQAQRMQFSKAIKSNNNDMLLALENFQPEFYTPKSLLNIKDKDNYENIPENTVLGVFKEEDINNGVKIEPISLNKDSLNNIAVTTEMLIGMKKYADNLNKNRQLKNDQTYQQDKKMSQAEQYAQYMNQQGLDR